MNALFGLKTKLSISERAIVATATATAAYISALPAPMRPLSPVFEISPVFPCVYSCSFCIPTIAPLTDAD